MAHVVSSPVMPCLLSLLLLVLNETLLQHPPWLGTLPLLRRLLLCFLPLVLCCVMYTSCAAPVPFCRSMHVHQAWHGAA